MTIRCMSCLLVGTHSRTCPDLGLLSLSSPPVVRGPYTGADTEVLTIVIPREPEADQTLDHGLTWTGVVNALEKGSQRPAEARSERTPIPVWALASVFAGVVLMALGFLLNDPVSHLIFGAIHSQP